MYVREIETDGRTRTESLTILSIPLTSYIDQFSNNILIVVFNMICDKNATR